LNFGEVVRHYKSISLDPNKIEQTRTGRGWHICVLFETERELLSRSKTYMNSTKSYLFVFIVLALATFSASAQDTHKVEFFGGYSYLSVDTGLDDFDADLFDSRAGIHGFNGSVTGNVSKRIGIKFDFSTYSKNLFNDSVTDVKFRNNQFMGGVQFKNNEKDGPTLKPFAHVLAGVANQRLTCTGDCFGDGLNTSITETQNNFTMALGGGLDIKVHPRVDIRAFQIDYNPTFYKADETLGIDKFTQHNVRIGVGIVIH
jgi:opacity protein-like surface antigen